jgi:transglutaminase-like putative cysteine protease
MIKTDNQPIDASFFGAGNWLTEFVDADNLEIQTLHQAITREITSQQDRLIALRDWVASQVRYVKTVHGRIWIEGMESAQNDLWNPPALTARAKVGNCANKSFLLASLLRQELPPEQVYVVLGNLYNGHAGGHAWVQVNITGGPYIMESTRYDAPPLVYVENAKRYETIHLFNDQEVLTVPGKTALEPFSACYSTWLREYLDWAYINGGK